MQQIFTKVTIPTISLAFGKKSTDLHFMHFLLKVVSNFYIWNFTKQKLGQYHCIFAKHVWSSNRPNKKSLFKPKLLFS